MGMAGMFWPLCMFMQGGDTEESGVRGGGMSFCPKREKIVVKNCIRLITNCKPHEHLDSFYLN
jgi:hypothetical protein